MDRSRIPKASLLYKPQMKKAAVTITAAKGVLREAQREVSLSKLEKLKLFYGNYDFTHSVSPYASRPTV